MARVVPNDRQAIHPDCARLADGAVTDIAADMPIRPELFGICDNRASKARRN
jgi:hypothetical protein